jgi:hypothetical protein
MEHELVSQATFAVKQVCPGSPPRQVFAAFADREAPIRSLTLDPRPDPDDPLRWQARIQLERIRTVYEALRQSDPALAERVSHLVADQERVLAPHVRGLSEGGRLIINR